MKKAVLKFLLITILLAGGTLIYIYAQKNFMVRNAKVVNKTETTQEEQSENIGVLTDDDPWQEMNKLVAGYYDKQGVSYKGSIKVIDDNGEKEKIIEEKRFEYSSIGRSMYYRIGEMEFVSKPEMILIADHANKIISLSDQDPVGKVQAKMFDIAEFRTMMEKTKAKAKVTQLGDQKMLTIENIIDPQIQGYRIYYDPRTYQVTKILIGMIRFSPLSDEMSGVDGVPGALNEKKENIEKDNNDSENEIETYTYYVEMIYSEARSLNTTAKEFHPEDKFITKTKDKIELTKAFSQYQLLSNGNVINETELKDDQE